MTVDLTALEAADAALQALAPTNKFQSATQAVSAASLAVLKQAFPPVPPPSSETRAVYVADLGPNYDADLLPLIPALKAASYNTIVMSGQWPQSLAAVKAQGMRAWVSLGVWQTGGGWDQTPAEMIATAQQVVKTLPADECVFYLADEPAVGNTTFSKQILAFSNQLKAAVPGARTMIAYYDQATVKNYEGLDLIAADIYPNKFGFNWKLISNPGGTPPGLADACKTAGLAFTTVIAIASDTQPVPSASQIATWASTARGAGSQGFAVYAWNLGAESPASVEAVQAIP